jgi:hypothetical protein
MFMPFVFMVDENGTSCEDMGGQAVDDQAECETAAATLKLRDQTASNTSAANRPEGCYYTTSLWLSSSPENIGNGASDFSPSVRRKPICVETQRQEEAVCQAAVEEQIAGCLTEDALDADAVKECVCAVQLDLSVCTDEEARVFTMRDDRACLPPDQVVGAVSASITLDTDIDSIPEGSVTRDTFEAAFKTDVAATLTAASGDSVDEARIRISGIAGASVCPL